MSNLTQDKLDLMFSHINSVPRKSLGGKTPYEAFEFFYGKDTLDKLNIQKFVFFSCLYSHFTLKISKNQCFGIKFLLINSIYSVTRIYFFQIEFTFSIDQFMLFNDLSRLIQKTLKYKLRNVRKSLYFKVF